MYNGEYQQYISVVMKSESNEGCNDMKKKVVYLCKALSIRFRESKYKRNDNAFCAEVQIYQKGYAHDIIILGECLQSICDYMNQYSLLSIEIKTRKITLCDGKIDSYFSQLDEST